MMSWAICSTLLILTRNDAAALLTISSDNTSSGNVCNCLLKNGNSSHDENSFGSIIVERYNQLADQG